MQPSREEVLAELQRIKGSRTFIKSGKGIAILEHITHAWIAKAPKEDFSEILIGISVYDKDYDPKRSPKVRVAIGRLRGSLVGYYDEEGAGNPLRVTIGSEPYLPKFVYKNDNSPIQIAPPFVAPPAPEPPKQAQIEPAPSEPGTVIFGYTKTKHDPDQLDFLQRQLLAAQTDLRSNIDIRDHLNHLILIHPDKHGSIVQDCRRVLAELNLRISVLERSVQSAQNDVDHPTPRPAIDDTASDYLERDSQEAIEEEMRIRSEIVHRQIALYSKLENAIKTLTPDDDDDGLWLVRDQLRTAQKGIRMLLYLRASMERKLNEKLNPTPQEPEGGFYTF